MHILICYDVPSNRRRARLAKRLREYVDRVQKSVFEGKIDESRFPALRATIADEIEPREDNVRIYRLCKRCLVSVECVGITFPASDPDGDVVV